MKISYSIHLSSKVTAMNLVLIDCSFNPLSAFCRKGHGAPQRRGSTLTNKTQPSRATHTEKPKQSRMLKGSLCVLMDGLIFRKGDYIRSPMLGLIFLFPLFLTAQEGSH